MKTIFNLKNVDPMSQPLFLGKDLGIQRYDVLKYPVFKQLDDKQMLNFWRPQEIELKKDRCDFKEMTENEKFIFTSNLKYQTMLDSVICRGVPTLLEFVTNSELEACLMTWQFFEKIHSESYSYIIQNVYADSRVVFDGIYEDKEILKRANSAIEDYNNLMGMACDTTKLSDLKRQIYMTVVSINILEAVRFYVSFVCSFAFAENKKMVGNADIVKLIKRDEACVTPDTEVLTPNGWVRFDQLTNMDKVAQYHENGNIDFVTPNKIIDKQYDGDIILLHNNANTINMALTPDHRIVYERTINGEITECQAKDFRANHTKTIPVAGQLNQSKAELTKYERFLIALQADGSIHDPEIWNGKHCGCHRVSFSFKKQRKIDRMSKLLSDLGFEFSLSNPDNKGRKRFDVKVPTQYKLTKNFNDWVDLSDKCYNYCRQFIDEVVNWDGSVRKDTGSLYYSSIVESNVDIVQAVATLAGYKNNKFIQEDDRKASYSDVYRLSINPNKRSQSGQSLIKDTEHYKGRVYCVSVPSGMFVARRNGGVFITGNCHLANTQEILKILHKEESEGFIKTAEQCQDAAIQMFENAAKEEKEWASYLFKDGSIIGLNETVLHQYIDWLCMSRRKTIGLPYDNVGKNPIAGWTEHWMRSEAVQVAPQEHEITNYKIGASKNDLDDMDLDIGL